MTNNANFMNQGSSTDALSGQVDRILDHLDGVLDDPTESAKNGATSGASPDGAVQLLSFVIPVKDEQDTIESLAAGIRTQVPNHFRYEILFVDDGSVDHSWRVIESLCEGDPAHIRGIRFRHNAGKATSLAAGFHAARGGFVFTMDADLQDDPREISRFLSKINEGFDLVSGWKKVRHDPWSKVLPSRVFNVFASALGGVKLHDHNCGFKCYRSEVVKQIELHGELHRVIPSLANMHGFRCTEIEVQHHPREVGRSKYGLERILRGLSDITTTGFLRRYRQRPAHFFNAVAGVQAGLAVAALLVTRDQFASHLSSVLVAAVLFSLAGSSFLAGLLAELLIRGPLRVNEELPIQFDTGIRSLHDAPQICCQLPPPTNTVDRGETCSVGP